MRCVVIVGQGNALCRDPESITQIYNAAPWLALWYCQGRGFGLVSYRFVHQAALPAARIAVNKPRVYNACCSPRIEEEEYS